MPSIQLLTFLSVINFGGSVVLAIMAFGDVPLIHMVWQVTQQLLEGELVHPEEDAALTDAYSSDVMFVTVLSSLRNLLILPYLAYLARDGFQPQLFSVVTVCQSLTVAVGVELLARVDASTLKPIFMTGLMGAAALFAVVSLRRLAKGPTVVSNGQLTKPLLVGAVCAALVAGLGNGLMGISSPPLLTFILYFQLPSQLVRGTFPAAAAVVGIIRACYIAFRGQYHLELWPYYVISCCFAVLGIFVGNMFAKGMVQWVFHLLVVCLVFLTGVSMATVTVERLCVAFSIMFIYVAFAIQLAKRQTMKANAEKEKNLEL